MPMTYLYLHGFASSPRSAKAVYLQDRFHQQGISLIIPDLNQADFRHLTVSRQVQQVVDLLPPTPVTLIGSSLGGLTAAWLAEMHPQIERLILLAPAFQFLTHWLTKLGSATVDRWQQQGFLLVEHYAAGGKLPLDYEFVRDAACYEETALQRAIPTLILHGLQDEVIPIQASRAYAATRAWVQMIELASDHALTSVQEEIWRVLWEFLTVRVP
jgi:hypothetical protein